LFFFSQSQALKKGVAAAGHALLRAMRPDSRFMAQRGGPGKGFCGPLSF
jgi:hypothetical protein